MNKLYKIFMCCIFHLFFLTTKAQTPTAGITVGLLYSDDDQVAEGYTLFNPVGSQNVFLIDNCGMVVNDWNFNGTANFSGCYLLEDGSVAKLVNYNTISSSIAAYGDQCFERRAWDNTLLWQYCGTGIYTGIHSDLYPMPNGNFLAIVQRSHSIAEATAKGLWTNGNTYKTESIVEFEPVGNNDANVVWEWHQWDHVFQDQNPNVVETYGEIIDNPGKYNASFAGSTHYNGLDYSEERDQIIFSSWGDSEIYIIRHDISSEEAADSLGEFIFRWGSPQNYGHPFQFLLGLQHNPKFIPDSNAVHGGKISVFNNSFTQSQNNASGSCILNPIYDPVTKSYAKDVNGKWLPDNFDWAFDGDIFPGSEMDSDIMGGCDVQENGNVLITEATKARISEVTPDSTVVWVYQSPEGDNGYLANQGDIIPDEYTEIYKAEKYATNYIGLQGRNLTPLGIVEDQNMLSEDCWSPEMQNNAALSNIVDVENTACLTGNSIGLSPEFKITNLGSLDITAMEIEYIINGGTVNSYSWTGSLSFSESEILTLPFVNYIWQNDNEVLIEIVTVNGLMDDATDNNTISDTWMGTPTILSGTIYTTLVTDDYAFNTSWYIEDSQGNNIFNVNTFTLNDNQIYLDSIDLAGGCYKIVLEDAEDNGGAGLTIKDSTGDTIFHINGNQYSSEYSAYIIVEEQVIPPVANFTTGLIENELTVNNFSAGTDNSYFWDFGNGGTSTDFEPESIIYSESGDYEICLIVTNSAGSDTTCIEISIELTSIDESISKIGIQQIVLFPNPVSKILTIHIDRNSADFKNVSLRIYTISGKLVVKKKEYSLYNPSNLIKINIENLNQGVYLIKLEDGDDVFPMKFVKD